MLQESIYDGTSYSVIAEKYRTYVYQKTWMSIAKPVPFAALDVNGNIRANSSLVMFGEANSFDNGASGRRGLYVENGASTSWDYLTLQNNNGMHFKIAGNGFVGLGTIPESRLDIKQTDGSWSEGIKLTQGLHQWNMVADNNGERFFIVQDRDATKGITIVNGNVGIGVETLPVNYKMVVGGTLGARKIKVTQVANWADFVFHPGYELSTLADLERFIQQNRHLPGIPSEKEVMQDGIDLAEINKKLLQKVEELTLYIIQQDKNMAAMKIEIDAIKDTLKR